MTQGWKRPAACLAVFLTALALTVWVLLGQTHSPRALALPYTPQNTNGWTLTEEGAVCTLSRTLEALPDAPAGEFAVLRVTLSDQAGLTAALDGTVIFTSPPGERRGGVLTFSLPKDYAGQELTLTWERGELPLYPSVALTTPIQEKAIYYAQARDITIPAVVCAMVALLAVGLFCLSGALGEVRWSLLLLALGPASQALYWWGQLNEAIVGNTPEIILISWTNQVFLWVPVLFLIVQAERRGRWLIPWGILAALDFGLIPLTVVGYPLIMELSQSMPFLPGLLNRLHFLLEWAGVLLTAALAILEWRKKNEFFRFYAPPLLAAVVLCAGYAQFSGQWTYNGPDGPLHLLNWCGQILALAVSLLLFLRRSIRRDTELYALSLQTSLAGERLTLMEENSRLMGMAVHDSRHHYTVLRQLLREGHADRAANYLDDLSAQLQNELSAAYTVHPAVNTILSAILAGPGCREIRTEVRVELPRSLPVPDTDLAVLLMNLLENAVEANEKAPEGAEKWLRVTMHIRGRHLYVGVENARFTPVDFDHEKGDFRPSKPGGLHGLGLKSVRMIARKYHSELRLEVLEDAFSASTALLLPPETDQ